MVCLIHPRFLHPFLSPLLVVSSKILPNDIPYHQLEVVNQKTKMSAKRDESTRWGSYSKVDLAEKLLEKSDQSVSSEEPDEINGQTAALLRSYRKRIAILSGTCILLLISTLGFLTAYILKTPTDRECTDRTAIWCKSLHCRCIRSCRWGT